ncbi:DUF58 domain-containing protein [Leptodesmis sichuanensis]|uniref:DUF58 domain-containing protein n=1 Tax=Leptodesmis sichuanensis TaxID=2906798 RepID=UPI001F1A49C7|nr:DUF58 domain-containing protein [Leptodesmis sichuanensis]UIE36621.1 DUF58 domain-containing protein [Leptodesmis sichuanensis A121]
MRLSQRIAAWLETHWVAPAYSGWLLGSLSIFFFIAATNTLSGWLYVISGIGVALLVIAALLPERMLRSLSVWRVPIHPVSAGDQVMVELVIENHSSQPKSLLQMQDYLPESLGSTIQHSIEIIPAHSTHHWIGSYLAVKRGIYRWQQVDLRTAAPLGLFWCRRSRVAKATAIVYPTVLPLLQCPLIDQMGRDQSLLFNSDRRAQAATEGLTRSLRPYRWGDPIRLVHWRTSARYGDLRVRELEVFTGGQELIIALDSDRAWYSTPETQSNSEKTLADEFEQAVIAAASLYFYACHQNLHVQLWTAETGLIHGNQVILEALAAVQAGKVTQSQPLPSRSLLWLTQNPTSLPSLPPGSRWILWPGQSGIPQKTTAKNFPGVGLLIHDEQPLQLQLQAMPR